MPPPKHCPASCPGPRPQGAGPRLPGPATRTPRDLESATKAALGALARRWRYLQGNWTPWMSSSQAGQPGRTSAVARPGMAWTPPGSCWDGRRQPGRLGSEAALARLWGGPAARLLGRTDRHRLNRGDRHANHAVWRITLVHMPCHEPTKLSVQRHTQQGLSQLDILRCRKRSIAREVHHHLLNQPNPPPTSQHQERQRTSPATDTTERNAGMLLGHLRPVPGRDGQPESLDRGQGRHQEPRPWAAAAPLRRAGPDRPVGDRQPRLA